MTDVADQLESLRATRDALALQQEVAELKATVRVADLLDRDVLEGWGDLVDPNEWLHDDPGFLGGRPSLQISQVGDRQDGRNRPIFETEHELAAIRGAARLLHAVFPTARCVTHNLANFCMRTGFRYKLVARDPADEALAEAVQGIFEEAFLWPNHWVGNREREAYIRAVRDGETFLHVKPTADGHAKIQFIEPEQVTQPQDSRAIEEWLDWQTPSSWSFGIHSDWRDVDAVHGYYVQWTDSAGDFDYLPAAEVVHIRRNVDTGIKRGLSDFYAVQGTLSDVGKLERNVAKGAAVLSAILGIREHPKSVTRDGAESFIAGLAYRRRTEATPMGSRTVYTQKVAPGSWLDVPAGMSYKQSPLANQGVGQAFVTIEQALLRTIGSNWCMPEYMISGDASNANYASTMVAESPFVKNCEAEQGFLYGDFHELSWKALRVLYALGHFRGLVASFADLRRRISLSIQGPRVAARDADKETSRRDTLNQRGILSDDTWAAEEGYDLSAEREKGAQRPLVASPQVRMESARRMLWEGYP